MSQSWTDQSYAHALYLAEKAFFAGNLVGSILYGIIIVLFFECMAALFNPAHRGGEGIKWGLVSYTVVMFLLITVKTAMNLDVQSISFIDNREFPGTEEVPTPGPYGYLWLVSLRAIRIIPTAIFPLTNWLADGLLLYRCYVIYGKKLWVIAFPCLMYLGSVAIATVLLYQSTQPLSSAWYKLSFTTPYYSILVSLNILLTLMIVTRLVLHTWNNRAALGASGGIGGLYKALITMLIESCALYAVSSLLVLTQTNVARVAFLSILYETQVIAPLLIILRVANRSALISGGGCAYPNLHPIAVAGRRGGSSDEFGVGVETTIDTHLGVAH